MCRFSFLLDLLGDAGCDTSLREKNQGVQKNVFCNLLFQKEVHVFIYVEKNVMRHD